MHFSPRSGRLLPEMMRLDLNGYGSRDALTIRQDYTKNDRSNIFGMSDNKWKDCFLQENKRLMSHPGT